MQTINTLADFKRAIKVGAKVHTMHHKFGDMGVRTISIAQSNSFALATNRIELIDVEAQTANINIKSDSKFIDFIEAKFILHQQKVQYKYGDIISVNDSVFMKVVSTDTNSWCEYPKAKDIQCNGTNTVTIFWGEGAKRESILTYTFLD